MLRPVILLLSIMGLIGAWQIFDQVKLLTAGGSLNTTLVPVFIVYNEGLGYTGPPQMGYASSRAIIVEAIIITFTLIQQRWIEGGTDSINGGANAAQARCSGEIPHSLPWKTSAPKDSSVTLKKILTSLRYFLLSIVALITVIPFVLAFFGSF